MKTPSIHRAPIAGLRDDWPPRLLQALGRFLPESIVEVLLNRVGAGREYRPDRWNNPRMRRAIVDEICRRSRPFLEDPDRDLPRLAFALVAAHTPPVASGTARNSRVVPVEGEADILTARTEALDVTREMGLTAVLRTRGATVVSELARNIVQHAGKGQIVLDVEDDHLVIRARDKGPGVRDKVGALQRSPDRRGNTGLLTVRRLADELQIQDRPTGGAMITAKLLIP